MILVIFESTSSGNISLYHVSCIGITSISELSGWPYMYIYVFHKNYQKYPELQENGSADSTSEFVSYKSAFCNPNCTGNLYGNWIGGVDSLRSKYCVTI